MCRRSSGILIVLGCAVCESCAVFFNTTTNESRVWSLWTPLFEAWRYPAETSHIVRGSPKNRRGYWTHVEIFRPIECSHECTAVPQ